MASRQFNNNGQAGQRHASLATILRRGIVVGLGAVVGVLVCPAANAQQSGNPVDFPAFDELMPSLGGPDGGSRQRSSAFPLTIPEPRWPTQTRPAADSVRPEFDSNLRFNGRGFDALAPNFDNAEFPAARDSNSTRPISQSRTLDDRDSRSRFGRDADSPQSRDGIPYEYLNRAEAEERFSTGDPPVVPPEFDWSHKSTSVADLQFPGRTSFVQNSGFMTQEEEGAYLELMATADDNWQRLLAQHRVEATVGKSPTALWEEAFYRFPEVRRLAWRNGKLRAREVKQTFGDLPDPFGDPIATNPANLASAPYRLLDDIAQFPDDFVGRPIILYGRFTAGSDVKIVPPERSAEYDGNRFSGRRTAATTQPGNTYANANGDLPPVPETKKLLRGTLIDLSTTKQLATVDTSGLIMPSDGLLGTSHEWRMRKDIPVMIKGWVVKHWKDNRPLIYCHSMRLITPRPHVDLIRKSTIDKRRLRDEETWLYYETLKQLELTEPSGNQPAIAAALLQQRIDRLMGDIMTVSKAELVKLSGELDAGAISQSAHDRRKEMLQRRLKQRLKRYKSFQRDPADFQMFVDMFQHPDDWHGELVTLHGHVRHVVSYPSDPILFNGKNLHELWLFTDDSQHNPAVIVTPNLPADFPRDAEVVDHVTVTGCFFKRYVYGSQDTDRIAPLILASKVRWRPTVDQVQEMVAAGLVSSGAPRAVRAAAIAGDRTSDAAMLLAAFLVALMFMILWGRAQREERDRVHLRKVINDVPVFENPSIDGYSALLAEIHDDPSNDHLTPHR